MGCQRCVGCSNDQHVALPRQLRDLIGAPDPANTSRFSSIGSPTNGTDLHAQSNAALSNRSAHPTEPHDTHTGPRKFPSSHGGIIGEDIFGPPPSLLSSHGGVKAPQAKTNRG
jgi:hypothetical protein